MLNRKRLVQIVFLAAILCFLGACSKTEETDSKNLDNDESDEISIMVPLHTPEVPNDKLKNELEKATGFSLDITWIPASNYDDRVNSAFATNSLTQAVPTGYGTFIQFIDAIQDGQFWEIGPYLDEFDNLSKLNEDILSNQLVDDKLYSLYMGRPRSRAGIIYRKDWADTLGLSTPTNTAELYEMIKAFTEEDPNKSGEDDTLGLVDRTTLTGGSFKTMSSWFGTPNNWGEVDGELLPEFMFPEYKETLNYLKKIHSNNYVNEDFPVTSKTDQVEMMVNGTGGVYVGTMGDVQSMYNDAIELNPDVEFDVHNYIEGPDGEYGVFSNPGFGSLVLFPKSAIETEEELKKVLEFFDYLMTEDGANLIIWGIEDEHYEVVDGKANIMDENQHLHDLEVKPYSSFEIGESASNGRYEGYYSYEPRTKADMLYEDNDNYLIEDPAFTLISETYLNNGGHLDQIIEDATYNYIIGQIDEAGFDEAVENWRNSGGDAVISEYNEAYKK
ncbi:extracellular solute-binding protein [Gracilibacillus saliphilus]|uniref:extracellular solute-binding protein n=1 Tax=Gracilibacillus saliphilus TaxID=543890 RepID=UPI0013D7E598|nr:extracellular solute-binding protein [Gracilibacillus saliphilus]